MQEMESSGGCGISRSLSAAGVVDEPSVDAPALKYAIAGRTKSSWMRLAGFGNALLASWDN